jgi:hypothetical protein
MRPLPLALFVSALAIATLPARDAQDDRRTVRRAAEPDRQRLQQYLAAFRRLSPEVQARVRRLDKDLQEEDKATRDRLFGVMERYALWLSRLSDTDRQRIQAASAGPERLSVVRAVLDQQWLDGLPPGRKELLAKASAAEQKTLIEKWRKEDQQRQLDRNWELRRVQEAMIPGVAERRKQFRDDVERFVKKDLEPLLTPREKQRLQTAASRGTGTFAYLHQVWVLSAAHNRTPPGSEDVWMMFRDLRR